MAARPFASSADLGVKEQTLEVLADGVYALTAEGDPNLGAIEGEDFLVCFEALATPVALSPSAPPAPCPPRPPPAAGWPSCASTPTSRSAISCCRTTTPSGC